MQNKIPKREQYRRVGRSVGQTRRYKVSVAIMQDDCNKAAIEGRFAVQRDLLAQRTKINCGDQCGRDGVNAGGKV